MRKRAGESHSFCFHPPSILHCFTIFGPVCCLFLEHVPMLLQYTDIISNSEHRLFDSETRNLPSCLVNTRLLTTSSWNSPWYEAIYIVVLASSAGNIWLLVLLITCSTLSFPRACLLVHSTFLCFLFLELRKLILLQIIGQGQRMQDLALV